jgi:hypothetical protein
MAFTPIARGTLNWDVPVNAALEELWGEISGASYFRLVAAADAPASVRARAQYVCDGTADNVQIQAAIDAAKADGGGIVQLSVGTFHLADTITISGNVDEDDADSIILRGSGKQATYLKLAVDTDGINLTDWCVVNISHLAIVAAGTGSCITSTAVLSGNEVSFWHSKFSDLRLNGYLGSGSTSGWGMDLSMPWRSKFENIEVEGMANGLRLSNQGDVQNAGDCVFERWFIEIVGDNHVAIHITGSGNNMNQNNFDMVEIGANGAGCTGILIDGTDPVSSQRFWGLNAEQFRTTVNVAKGDSCVFQCNYVTGKNGDSLNKTFVVADGSYNNYFSATKVNINSGGTCKVIEDNNDTSNAPNVFERIRIENNSDGSATYSKRTSTVLREITAFNEGTIQAGLLQYPLSTVNNPDMRADDHGYLSWSIRPTLCTVASSSAVAHGVVILTKVKIVNRATVVTNVIASLSNGIADLTTGQNFAGLYNSSGTLLAATADQTTAWATSGVKTMALTSPQTLAVGTYYVALLTNGSSTQVPFISAGGGFAGTVNAGLTTGTAQSLTSGTSQTSLPSSITLGSGTTNGYTRFVALS